MSLALAQILIKGDGSVSLDKARAQHAHHGLVLKGAAQAPIDVELSISAAALRAVPAERDDGIRFGTFHLWHRSSRETPIGGDVRTINGQSFTQGFRILFGGSPNPFPVLPSAGMSLLDCFKSLPCMASILSSNGIAPSMVRASLSATHEVDQKTYRIAVTIHPATPEALEAAYAHMKFSAAIQPILSINELPSGCIININSSETRPAGPIMFPNGTQITQSSVYMFGDNQILNEFGVFYTALYILGNYVRYFPDRWMADVERSSPLAQAANELIWAAEDRVPLLALSELSQTFIVGD